MFKLVAIGGKFRGQEYPLEEGENIIGRDAECNVHIDITGVSKQHLSITVSGDSIYAKDLNSSNGTLVNRKSIKTTTLKSGDEIAIPDLIFKVVHIKEQKIIIKKKIQRQEVEKQGDDHYTEPAPKSPFGKIIWFFKFKIMQIFHGFNKEYEWRSMLGILIAIFITSIIALTILPVLQSSRKALLIENVKRGVQYVSEIKRLNTTALAQRNLNNIRTNFLEEEGSDVESYELLDLEQRIISPATKRNRFTQNPFSVDAINFFKKEENKYKTHYQFLSNGVGIGVAKALVAYNVTRGYEETIGVIAIIFTPSSLATEAKQNGKSFAEAWSTSAILAIIFFGILYYLTTRPFIEVRAQIEEALRGQRKSVETTFLFEELTPLKQSINSMLQRIRELQNDDEVDDFSEMEDDSKYVMQLEEFMRGADGAVIILNSSQQVESINTIAEDLIGIRESSSKGSPLDEIVREQGLAATISSLCDRSANNDGTCQEDVYELGGVEHNIYVNSLIGKDTFAKAFYITFVKES